MKKPTEETCADISDTEEDQEQFERSERTRRSYDHRRCNVLRSSSDRYPSNMWLSTPHPTSSHYSVSPTTSQHGQHQNHPQPHTTSVQSPPMMHPPYDPRPPQNFHSGASNYSPGHSYSSPMHSYPPRTIHQYPRSASSRKQPRSAAQRRQTSDYTQSDLDSDGPLPHASIQNDPDMRSIHLTIRTTMISARALRKQIQFINDRLGNGYPRIKEHLTIGYLYTERVENNLILAARSTRNPSQEEEDIEDHFGLPNEGVNTRHRAPPQRHQRHRSHDFHVSTAPITIQRHHTHPKSRGITMSPVSDDYDYDTDDILSPLGKYIIDMNIQYILL